MTSPNYPAEAASLVIPRHGEVELGRRPVREPAPGELVIRAEHSGVSVGTEMAGANGKSAIWGDPPFTPGYQAVGRVVAFGPDTDHAGLAEGDLVATFSGYGTHAAYVTTTLARTHRVDETELSRFAGLFVQPAVGSNAVNKAAVSAGERVLIIGQGLIGQSTAMLARMRGAYVVVCDVSPQRLELSARYCADRAIDTAQVEPWDQLRDDFPEGFDVVIESTGVGALVDPAMRCLSVGGRFVFEGYYPGTVSFTYDLAHRKEATAIFPFFIGDPEHRLSVLRQISSGRLDLRPLITHDIGWRESADVYRELFGPRRDELGGILIDWTDAS